MSTRRTKVTVDSESDAEASSDWSEEDEDEDEVVTAAVHSSPVAVVRAPPTGDPLVRNMPQSIVSPSVETQEGQDNDGDAKDPRKLISPVARAIP